VGIGAIVPGILLLGIVIFVHELGHFLAAKWRGVKVLKFSLGMGPEMLGFTHGDTRYCLSWIPLGGFVQMAGDHLNDDGTMPEGGPEKFLTHPWFGRVIIAAAGPAANLVTAFVVLAITFMSGVQQPDWPNRLGPVADTTAAWAAGLREGDTFTRFDGHVLTTWHELELAARDMEKRTSSSLELARGGSTYAVTLPPEQMKKVLADLQPPAPPAVVGGVATGMPAYRAGVKEGDRILAVDGQPVETFSQIARALRGRADQPIVFHIERDRRKFDLTITPMRVEGAGEGALIGIEAQRGMEWTERLAVTEAVPAAFRGTGRLVADVYGSLWLTISRPAYYREAVGGPIFIGQMASESARRGLDRWLYLMALINIAIMAFNLLPVPLLDGGHITLAVLEGLRRRAVSGRTYMNFQKVGLVLVGTLFVFILSKDLMRPFQRLRAIDQAPRETTTVAPSPR
jgi:regulator of sigma E protease